MLLLGSGALVLGRSQQNQPLAGAVILMPPLFILFAVMRFLWAFRLRVKCSWSEATDALVVLLGLTWVVALALACIRELVSRQGVFLRTPKQAERPTRWDSIRIVWVEFLVGAACLGLAATLVILRRGSALSAWGIVILMLLWQAAVDLCAVRSSRSCYAEARPARPNLWLGSFHTLALAPQVRYRTARRVAGHRLTLRSRRIVRFRLVSSATGVLEKRQKTFCWRACPSSKGRLLKPRT